MRVLLFSDHHAHSWKPYSNILPEETRLQDGINVLKQITRMAKDKNVDVILFAGDMFHARGTIHVKTFNAVFEEIAKMSMYATVGLLVGNHDQMNRQGDIHSVYALGSIVTVMSKPGWYQLTPKHSSFKLNVFAVPYHPVKDDILAGIDEGVKTHPGKLAPNIMLGHFGIDGAVVGSNFVLVDKSAVSAAQLKFQEFDEVFMGHYHEPQKIAPNARYLGATHHHNWGDVGSERGCWLWDTGEKDEYFDPQLVPLVYPRFIAMTNEDRGVDVEDCYVKIKQTAPCSDRSQFEQALMKGGARVVEWELDSIDGFSVSYTGDFRPGMDYEEMVESYVRLGDSILDEDTLIDVGKSIIRQVS